MERIDQQKNKKSQINRAISYVVIVFSVVVLAFCVSEITKYIIHVSKNAALTKELENLMQDTNYLRENFDVLKNDEYYSVYVENEYQYVDNGKDPISIIK